ncbi:MAG: MarR family winged helix-turn-helix transcriptional regulator [Lachnospiraceae bacterium]|jgi:DNA-binding MarR family transcriptional regulator|nr:MarR family winged helix-turn-helix transcriptional regulator [Lachnospiraceae bacterium]
MKPTPSAAPAYTSILRTKINLFLREKLKECGYEELIPSYGSVLSVVYKNGGKVQIKTIYDTLCKQKPTITESINRLVKFGYLTRENSPEDARCTYVVATEKALALKKDFNHISDELQNKIFKGFSVEEQQTFVTLMVRAIENFN